MDIAAVFERFYVKYVIVCRDGRVMAGVWLAHTGLRVKLLCGVYIKTYRNF